MDYASNTLEHQWMPFTANRDFKAAPRLLVKAEGMYYWNHHGERMIDGSSGLFNVAPSRHRGGPLPHLQRPLAGPPRARRA